MPSGPATVFLSRHPVGRRGLPAEDAELVPAGEDWDGNGDAVRDGDGDGDAVSFGFTGVLRNGALRASVDPTDARKAEAASSLPTWMRPRQIPRVYLRG